MKRISTISVFTIALAISLPAAAAADCVGYIDAQAVHDEAVAEAESVYKEAVAPAAAAYRKARAEQEEIVTAKRWEAWEAHQEARQAYFRALAAYKEAQNASLHYLNKEREKYPDIYDWKAVAPKMRRIAESMEEPARKALRAAGDAESAAVDRFNSVGDVAGQAKEEALAIAKARYEAASGPQRTARDETKQQARAALEARYIEIYSAGRDMSGYRRESVLKAAQGEFANLCSQ